MEGRGPTARESDRANEARRMRGEHDGRDRAAGERSGRQEAGTTPAKTGEHDASTAFRVESLVDSHRGKAF